MALQKATRVGVTPLIALYAQSGAGKTYSALLLARGFVGPDGLIALIDSENRRASLYADVIPGGFEVENLKQPYRPKTYIAAIREVEKSGAKIGIIDSGSHEWESEGGVRDMAVDEEKAGKKGMLAWNMPKNEHAKFVRALMTSHIPWIICLRAKYKMTVTMEKGKMVPVKDEFISPIQNEEFLFEMTAHMEIRMDHTVRLTKWSHPELKKCFPSNGPITTETGSMVAKWCAAGGSSTSVQGSSTTTSQGSPPAVTTPPSPAVSVLKKELWDLTKEHHKGNKMAFEQYLFEEGLIGDQENVASLSVERLEQLIVKVNQKTTT